MALKNPLELDSEIDLSPRSVVKFKRTDCAFYSECMDQAARKGWRQFHCNSCKAFEQRQDTRDERVQAMLPTIYESG
jgi:hypothetical protein